MRFHSTFSCRMLVGFSDGCSQCMVNRKEWRKRANTLRAADEAREAIERVKALGPIGAPSRDERRGAASSN